MNFPKLSKAVYQQRLAYPKAISSIILDTDTYCEIDDPFALTYALLAHDTIKMQGVTAAPFSNPRSDSPKDGMEKSYHEILRIMDLADYSKTCPVKRGSTMFIPDKNIPVQSSATDFIIEQALEFGKQGKTLYIVGIAAATNIASAIVQCPEIIQYITVVWLGGHPQNWSSNEEFNLYQDVTAAQLIFDCGVPLIQIPCKNVAEHLTTSPAELAVYIKGKSAIGSYLYNIFKDYAIEYNLLSKVIWDISAIAFFTTPEYMSAEIISSPILNNDKTWTMTTDRHPIRVITDIKRDFIFRDFFARIQNHGNSTSKS
ncbi:MAG: nucleoside hydrolase [Lentisphaeria bacterium]